MKRGLKSPCGRASPDLEEDLRIWRGGRQKSVLDVSISDHFRHWIISSLCMVLGPNCPWWSNRKYYLLGTRPDICKEWNKYTLNLARLEAGFSV